MFIMVLRKIMNNKWLVLCLLIGIIISVAIISSMPVYTDGVLQRLLTRDLENYQQESSRFPGTYLLDVNLFSFYSPARRSGAYWEFDQIIREDMIPGMDLPVLVSTNSLSVNHLTAIRTSQIDDESPVKLFPRIEAIEGMENHLSLIRGKMFSNEATDGIIEAVVTEETMHEMELVIGETYHITDFYGFIKEPLKIHITGVFTVLDPLDVFWYQSLKPYKGSLLIDYSLFRSMFTDESFQLLASSQWFFAFDYHALTIENLSGTIKSHNENVRSAASFRSLNLSFPAEHILDIYHEREQQLKITLLVLQVPTLLMLIFYLFMVSQLIVGNDLDEIAVLKSRGASTLQIFLGYLTESILLCGIALITGPLLGLYICRIIGSTNGFMDFVQRVALPVSLSKRAYLYAVVAVLISIITMLVPAVIYSKVSIVVRKQRKPKMIFWKKFGIDFILLILSGYGLYSYNLRLATLEATGIKGTEIVVDPFLFMISTSFILGAGMLFLRLYPMFVSLISWAGKEIWSPVFYASFLQVSRSRGQESYIMLFLIFSISIGLFNANSARTINTNIEERVYYASGSQITLQEIWPSDKPSGIVVMDPLLTDPLQAAAALQAKPVQYIEPDFSVYSNMTGVDFATKVFRQERTTVRTLLNTVNNVSLLGIIPYEYPKAAWFRTGLLPYHINEYMNLMTYNPRAVILSRTFENKYGVRTGDLINISWGNQGLLECVVYAFIDYWPTYNPYDTENDLVIANLDYIRAKMVLEPYEVWIRKSNDTTSQDIYTQIQANDLRIERLIDTNQQIIAEKNDPMLQGTNGALTLGFIVTILIAFTGFIIFWLLSIKKRELQLGIFRAMGLGKGRLMFMLTVEQLLISGAAVISGIVIGGLASELFVPLLQLAYGVSQQVPPFRVATKQSDYIKLYMIVIVMLAAGLTILGTFISKLRMSQAIKLGED